MASVTAPTPLPQLVPSAIAPTGGAPSSSSGAAAKTPENPSFFRRELPSPPAVALSDEKGRELFHKAMAQGTLLGYFKLAEQFTTQSEPAYCGLATLSMALNALSVDPGRTWKGVWRWYGEDFLDCCQPLELVQKF